jgi:hypothetical protein
VAGVAGAVAIGTGAFNTAVDCYQAVNGYAPVIDGASCAKSAVGVALDITFLGAGRLAGQAAWPKRGLLANSSRSTRRNVSQAATGTVEVAGYGFGRGVQRLFK